MTRHISTLFLRRLGMAAFLPVLGLSLAAEPVRAQPQDGQQFQDWGVRCEQNPQNAAQGGCFILHQVINNQNNKPVMVMAIGYVKADEPPVAVITVPLGVRLPPGVMIQIDQKPAENYSFERCMPDGCQIQVRMTDTQVATFKAGNAGKVLVQDTGGQNRAIPFSLKGFTAALTSLK